MRNYALILLLQLLDCQNCGVDKLPPVLTESQDLRVLFLHNLICAIEMLPSFLSHAGCLPRLLWLSLDYETVLACSEGLKAASYLQVGQCTCS